MTMMRKSSRTSPAAVLALVLHALVGVILPLGEVLHTHAKPHGAEWHAEGDFCDDAPGFAECALLRVGAAPGLPGHRAAAVAVPAASADHAAPARTVVRSVARSGATLPRAPPAT